MEAPRDVDGLLHSILSEGRRNTKYLSDLDHEFIRRMTSAMENGTPGVYVVQRADGEMDYIFGNLRRSEAVLLLGKLVHALTESIAKGDN